MCRCWNNATNDNGDAPCTKVPVFFKREGITCTCKQPELDFIWSAAGKPIPNTQMKIAFS